MIVYKVTNKINDKIYIGKTTKSLEKRKYRHEWETRRYKNRTYFHNALNKYGFESFNWEILHECDNLDKLNSKEQEFIKKYKSDINGYNLTIGGDGGDTLSNHHNLDKIGEDISRKLKKLWTDEYKKIFSEKVMDKKIREKISKKAKKRYYNKLVEEYGVDKANQIIKEREYKEKNKNNPKYIEQRKIEKNQKISKSVKKKYQDKEYYDEFCEINRKIDRTGKNNGRFVNVDEDIKRKIVEDYKKNKNKAKLKRDFNLGVRVIERILSNISI